MDGVVDATGSCFYALPIGEDNGYRDLGLNPEDDECPGSDALENLLYVWAGSFFSGGDVRTFGSRQLLSTFNRCGIQ